MKYREFKPEKTTFNDTDVGIVSSDEGAGKIKTRFYQYSALRAWILSYLNDTFTSINNSLSSKAPQSTTYTKTETDTFNPDFYQYSIVHTVVSGNLTGAIKNYEGSDPTPTKPIKIMIGGVLRTITSALSFTANAGTGYLNLGSTELATKEAEIFTLLQWNTTTNAVNILGSRFPGANRMGDFTNSATGEKGLIGIINYNSSDSIAYIGRFNATLSAGPGYTWSIPATSVIVNSPIYDSRNTLTFDSALTASGSMTVTSPVKGGSYYKVQGDMFEAYVVYTMTLGGTASSEVRFTLPFSINNVSSWMYEGMGSYWNGTVDVLAVCSMDNVNKNIVRVKKGDGTNFTLGAGQEIKFMIRGRL